MSFEKLFKCKNFNNLVFVLFNKCNLSCVECSQFSNKKNDAYYKYSMSLKDIERFCDVFRGYGQNMVDEHRLSGGEPTFKPEFLCEVIEILNKENRFVCLQTNGFKLEYIDRDVLKKVGRIFLDFHGRSNKKDFVKSKKYLKSIGYSGWVDIRKVKYHYDLLETSGYHANQVCCGKLWEEPSFDRNVLFPCCTLATVDRINNVDIIRDNMVKRGFYLYNDLIINDIKKFSFDDAFKQFCYYKCWRPNRIWGKRFKI